MVGLGPPPPRPGLRAYVVVAWLLLNGLCSCCFPPDNEPSIISRPPPSVIEGLDPWLLGEKASGDWTALFGSCFVYRSNGELELRVCSSYASRFVLPPTLEAVPVVPVKLLAVTIGSFCSCISELNPDRLLLLPPVSELSDVASSVRAPPAERPRICCGRLGERMTALSPLRFGDCWLSGWPSNVISSWKSPSIVFRSPVRNSLLKSSNG
uniref:Secreted peptide n=1 Tax=Anopheles braziliensis TaxID=58242 RepID=A0A2M3ZLV7_9DIPT